MVQESKEIVVPQAHAMAVLSAGSPLEGLGEPPPSERRRPPMLRIVHPGSLKKGDARTAGQLQVGTLHLDDPEVVFLKLTYFRELTEGKDRDQKTVCASDDAKVPLARLAHPKYDKCIEGECPFATWDDDVTTGKRKPPPCKIGYAFFGVLPKHNFTPFIFTVKNWEAVKGAKEMIDQMAMDFAEPRPRGIYDYVVKISTEGRKNGGLNYFIPIFTAVRRPLEQDDPYREMFLALKDVVYQPFVSGAEETGEDAPEGERDVTPGAGEQPAPLDF